MNVNMNADVTRLLSILAQTSAAVPPPLPPPPPPAAAAVDPASITDWPAALKYVMNTVYRNEDVMAQIKKMKRHQHDHEKQWWAARDELVRKHEARAESSKKVADLLKKLGTTATLPGSSALPTPDSEREELRVFDKKVHTRSEEMVRHMAAEFAAMGIPFFCQPGEGGAELQALRRRVVELLEDLCEGE